jgi:hypothetical protein
MDRDGGEVTANALLKRNFPRRVNALVDQTTGRKFTRSEDPDAIQIAQKDTNPKKIWVDKFCLIFNRRSHLFCCRQPSIMAINVGRPIRRSRKAARRLNLSHGVPCNVANQRR